MINRIDQVMLYVEDVSLIKDFWVKILDFKVIEEANEDGMHYAQIAPSDSAETSFTLFERKVIEAQSPELNFGTPSIMFETDDAVLLYDRLKKSNVVVGEIVQMPYGIVFNFSDPEGNYFAVMDNQVAEDND